MVSHGLQQAQESTEYKETREYLKKIQAEFKGIRMVKEQREELYTRLQSAFETLNIRLDVYFREKQKNWEVRMSFKLKDLIVNVEEMEKEIQHHEENLLALQDQLEIVLQKPLEVSARVGLEARIHSTHKAMAELRIRKAETENEIVSLRQRLYGNEAEA
jgi:predicted  nucleic acid-binding Zn-ribbon protein